MGVYETDMYADGMTELCLTCHPCLATAFYEVLLIYGYI